MKCDSELARNGTCISFQCCKTCCEIDRAMVANAYNDQKLRLLWIEEDKHMRAEHGRVSLKKSHSGNGKHNGCFAFTLTSSPTDGLSVDDLLIAVEKLMNQKSSPVKRYAWYLEYKENNTHPHIHGIYETESGGRIEAKIFKRCWKVWDEKYALGQGHRGGYHRPVNNLGDYGTYIAKDSGPHRSKGFVSEDFI